ncbi:DEAD/DEAH box helicase domain protein [Clostridium neonatale]|uniref:DEAD/DEAH box helicase n=1 Tax=Clostridium neonatale TaxID=137838 RepID=UPI00291BD891|nr:DEAD/DEAH box helicase [Clostridium neonatale]CAI3238772.1 DEAD/DEAH box helicase domain protein [Clostridium neonatale]CAI3539836.1 DEAD/DEAH box helicase domain protein [Clostridium neonatale]
MIINRECLKLIDELIDKYVEIEIKRDFLKSYNKSDEEMEELAFLSEKALILADSNSFKNKERALKIATLIAKQYNNNQLNSISSIILGRLKNFRSQELLSKNKEYNISNRISPFDMLKNILYKENNTIEIANEKYLLSDFQLRFYELVNHKKVVSISAPTSIGKSFIIKRIIIDLLLKELNTCVYIVPSRALITEVMNDIRKEISRRELNKAFNLSSSSDIRNINNERKTILVLTQERFYQLCNNNELKVDMLIVDEAQNVINGSRGILLEYSVKYARRLWNNMKIVFISPLINNPEKFNERFSDDEIGGTLNIQQPTVRQNIIKLYKDTIGYKVVINKKTIQTKVKINKSGSVSDNISNVVLKFNNGENSIIYCNRTNIAVKVCEKLCNSGSFEDLGNDALNEFADFIEYSISNKYLLSKYIRKGIVYHYGNLPPFIRGGIEELASEGYFKIIACTSTLLQGVNLPAQNIYIYSPCNGDVELTNLEFWNLAGRAGRMGYDFCGNIILIENKYWTDIDRYDEKFSKVEFISDSYKNIEDLTQKIGMSQVIDRNNDNDEIDDYVVSSAIIDRMNGQDIVINEECKDLAAYKNLETMIDGIIDNFEPPKELLMRLVGIKYTNIKKLWTYFISNEDTINNLLLPHPFSVDSATFITNYKKIIKIINDCLMDEHLYSEYDCEKLPYMSYSWIMENKLRSILLYKIIKYNLQKISSEEEISAKVEEQVKYLNNNIRFKLVKGFYAYGEILKEYLKQTKREKMLDNIINMPMYLEVGACRKSTIELISLGMNREFAIEVIDKYKIRENYIITDLKKINLDLIKNNYLKNKLSEFIKTV